MHFAGNPIPQTSESNDWHQVTRNSSKDKVLIHSYFTEACDPDLHEAGTQS